VTQKKERVLHTRIPAVLEAELKRFADNLRIPVSNLVRTILEDAVSVADAASSNVEAGLKSAAAQLHTERERLRARVRIDPLKGVFAFQEVTLAQKSACARCSVELVPGARAHLGLTDAAAPGTPRIFVCDDCVPRV
jgi:predicted transcriptional regulator